MIVHINAELSKEVDKDATQAFNRCVELRV